MSKTLGNVIDPLDTIKEFGADALRFTLALGTAGQVRFSLQICACSILNTFPYSKTERCLSFLWNLQSHCHFTSYSGSQFVN